MNVLFIFFFMFSLVNKSVSQVVFQNNKLLYSLVGLLNKLAFIYQERKQKVQLILGNEFASFCPNNLDVNSIGIITTYIFIQSLPIDFLPNYAFFFSWTFSMFTQRTLKAPLVFKIQNISFFRFKIPFYCHANYYFRHSSS